jgi:hypothetical protein
MGTLRSTRSVVALIVLLGMAAAAVAQTATPTATATPTPTPWPILPEKPAEFLVGGRTTTTRGQPLVAGTIINVERAVHHVSGTGVLVTIIPPWPGFTGQVTLIADDGFTLNTGGNVALPGEAGRLRPCTLKYDGSLWYHACFATGQTPLPTSTPTSTPTP